MENAFIWEKVFASPNLSIVVSDSKGKFLQVNESAQRFFGYSEAELRRLTVKDITISEDLADSEKNWKKVTSGGVDYFQIEKRYVRKNGDFVWGKTNVIAARNESGELEIAVAIIEEINELRDSQIQLEEYSKFFSLALDLLCMANMDGHFVKVNPSFTRVLGYPEEEFLNRPFIDFVHPDDVEPTLAQLEKLSRGIPILSFENRCMTKDGKYVWLSWNSAPVIESGLVYAAAHDISELKKTQLALEQKESELKAHSEKLEKSNDELDQFAYIVSHDLKAPLRAINSLATFIEEDMQDKMDPDSLRHFDLLQKRTKRMENLIEAILAYSTIGRIEHPSNEIDLQNMIEEIIEIIAPPKGVKISIAADLPKIYSVKPLVYQVFQNLIANAVKYGEAENPKVEIGYKSENGNLKFWVKDNGPGIHPDFHERIFKVFQTNQSRDTIESTGIGLSIVKKVIEDILGGKAGINSQLGDGALFWFYIPDKHLVA